MESDVPGDPRQLRVSHADRDRMVEILRDAAGDGRLESDELEERVERALSARTFAELEPLTADLPVQGPKPPRVASPVTPASVSAPGDAREGDVVRWEVHGLPLRREGAWAVPPVVELSVHGGTASLDFTQARWPESGDCSLLAARERPRGRDSPDGAAGRRGRCERGGHSRRARTGPGFASRGSRHAGDARDHGCG